MSQFGGSSGRHVTNCYLKASPAAAPPPPPPPPSGPSSTPSYHAPSPSSSAPPPPSSAPPPPSSRPAPQPMRTVDPSSYTLSSNGGLPKNPSPHRNSEPTRRIFINDPRWKFQEENMLPKPRDFVGGAKRYRAGRGSSVPLDLSNFS